MERNGTGKKKEKKKESAAGVSLTPRRRYCVPLECLSRGLEGPGPRNKDLLSHTQPSPWYHGSLTRANREIRNRAENHGPFESRARPIAIASPPAFPSPYIFIPAVGQKRGSSGDVGRECTKRRARRRKERKETRETRNSPICCETRYRFPGGDGGRPLFGKGRFLSSVLSGEHDNRTLSLSLSSLWSRSGASIMIRQ